MKVRVHTFDNSRSVILQQLSTNCKHLIHQICSKLILCVLLIIIFQYNTVIVKLVYLRKTGEGVV